MTERGAAHEKNAIFSAWVMRRIGARGSLAGARGGCRMPLARMVAPSEGSGSGEGIGSGETRAACAIGRVTPDEGMRPIWGYLLALFAGIVLVACVPWLSIGFL